MLTSNQSWGGADAPKAPSAPDVKIGKAARAQLVMGAFKRLDERLRAFRGAKGPGRELLSPPAGSGGFMGSVGSGASGGALSEFTTMLRVISDSFRSTEAPFDLALRDYSKAVTESSGTLVRRYNAFLDQVRIAADAKRTANPGGVTKEFKPADLEAATRKLEELQRKLSEELAKVGQPRVTSRPRDVGAFHTAYVIPALARVIAFSKKSPSGTERSRPSVTDAEVSKERVELTGKLRATNTVNDLQAFESDFHNFLPDWESAIQDARKVLDDWLSTQQPSSSGIGNLDPQRNRFSDLIDYSRAHEQGRDGAVPQALLFPPGGGESLLLNSEELRSLDDVTGTLSLSYMYDLLSEKALVTCDELSKAAKEWLSAHPAPGSSPGSGATTLDPNRQSVQQLSDVLDGLRSRLQVGRSEAAAPPELASALSLMQKTASAIDGPAGAYASSPGVRGSAASASSSRPSGTNWRAIGSAASWRSIRSTRSGVSATA